MTIDNAHNLLARQCEDNAFVFVTTDPYERHRPPHLNIDNFSSAQAAAQATEVCITALGSDVGHLSIEDGYEPRGKYPPSYGSGTSGNTVKGEPLSEDVRLVHGAFMNGIHNRHGAAQPLTWQALEALNHDKGPSYTKNIDEWVHGPRHMLDMLDIPLGDSIMGTKRTKPSVADSRATESSSWTLVTLATQADQKEENISGAGAQFEDEAARCYARSVISISNDNDDEE